MNIEAQEYFIRRELEAFRNGLEPAGAGMRPDVARMLDLIHREAFDASLNVNEVKKRCGIRDNNASSRFRRDVGVGVRLYIEKMRTEAAQRLLRNEKLAVFTIGWSVGYEYPESFCRAFRRHLGCTPTAYRQALRRKIVQKTC